MLLELGFWVCSQPSQVNHLFEHYLNETSALNANRSFVRNAFYHAVFQGPTVCLEGIWKSPPTLQTPPSQARLFTPGCVPFRLQLRHPGEIVHRLIFS